MSLSISRPFQNPCTSSARETHAFRTCSAPRMVIATHRKPKTMPLFETLGDRNRDNINNYSTLAKKWKEYHGISDWHGLLDPLDEGLRQEILRYGGFVDAAYNAFDADPASASYGQCKYFKDSVLNHSGLAGSGYRLTRNLRASSGVELPRWAPPFSRTSWIGYVAVCHDRKAIDRLGRRDIVIAFRGTATPLEWLENLRANLTPVCNSEAMVESGFLGLYTSGTSPRASLQHMVRTEIARLLRAYGDEPLSLTITGHSLGAALATLAAYDIKTYFRRAPIVTVMSFGGPRVGNRSFRRCLERQGTKVLRIVNADDPVTKVPGFVIDNSNSKDEEEGHVARWVQRRVEDTRWVYAEVGKELKLSSRECPYVLGNGFADVATCHDLKTYLHLVENFVSSTCPYRKLRRQNRAVFG